MTDIPRRIERLAARIDAMNGTPPAAAAAELAEIERDYAERFPIDQIDSWSNQQLDQHLLWHCGTEAERLDELRELLKTPAERAEDAAAAAEIEAMTTEQLDAYLAALCEQPRETPT